MLFTYIAVILVVLGMFASPALADWPSTMEVGGFTVTSISGTNNADGSGRAAGKVSIPGDGSCQIDLVRSASGSVTGSTRSNFSIAGVRIDGSFILDRQGLQGTGIIYTTGRQVTDANISVDARSGLSASGKLNLGTGFAISVTCEGGSSGFKVSGSAPRTATQDEAVAVYTFKGDIEVSNSGPAIAITAVGTVDRKGKVGGMISSDRVSSLVDVATGKAVVNAGGTNITFDLW